MQNLAVLGPSPEQHAALTAFRQDLHQYPEIGLHLERTADRVATALERHGGIEVHRAIGLTGVVAVVHGRSNESGRAIGFRADMDALPITEETGLSYASTVPGAMHACGHDGHTAVLLGTAYRLAERRNFDGKVVMIFQPAEEPGQGARAMLQDGLFDRFPVDALYALHSWPDLPAGTVGLNTTAMMAGADRFDILIEGESGHGAHPDMAVNPINIAFTIGGAAQSIVSSNVSPVDPAVLTFCHIQGGTPQGYNAIPQRVVMSGTIRTFDPTVQLAIHQRLRELCGHMGLAYRGVASVQYTEVCPPTINSPAEARFAAEVAERLLGTDHVVRQLPLSMGADDCGVLMQAVGKGAYLRLGNGASERALHAGRYDFNDAVIPTGVGFLTAIAEESLPLQVRL